MNKIALSSLAMDIKRIALGYHRKSFTMANRFAKEAIRRKKEIDSKTVKPYVKKLLTKFENSLHEKDKQKAAEDLLTYSTLFQNAALHEHY